MLLPWRRGFWHEIPCGRSRPSNMDASPHARPWNSMPVTSRAPRSSSARLSNASDSVSVGSRSSPSRKLMPRCPQCPGATPGGEQTRSQMSGSVQSLSPQAKRGDLSGVLNPDLFSFTHRHHNDEEPDWSLTRRLLGNPFPSDVANISPCRTARATSTIEITRFWPLRISCSQRFNSPPQYLSTPKLINLRAS